MPWYDAFDALVKEQFPQLDWTTEEPMSRHTTFRTGGPARRFARPGSTEELAALLDAADRERWPVLVLGNGSNVLAADQGVDALVIHTGRLDGVSRTGERTLRAEAGISLARLAAFAQREALSGLEFAHGIPGSLGGAVCMNAGAYGGEMRQVVTAVTAWLPGRGVVCLERDAMEFGYRHSLFSRQPGAALEAEFLLEPGDSGVIRARMDELNRRRREKQPLEYPSAGSTFKRPPAVDGRPVYAAALIDQCGPEGHFAGALIERCGLKGTRIGGAMVSEKHAGFIVNAGGASSGDVLELIAHVRRTVKEQTGVELEPEVKIV